MNSLILKGEVITTCINIFFWSSFVLEATGVTLLQAEMPQASGFTVDNIVRRLLGKPLEPLCSSFSFFVVVVVSFKY